MKRGGQRGSQGEKGAVVVRSVRRIFWLVVCIIWVWGLFVAVDLGNRVAGYAAKELASRVYVTGQEVPVVLQEFAQESPLLKYIKAEVDKQSRTTRVTFLGIFTRKAAIRPGSSEGAFLDYQSAKKKGEPWPAVSRHDGFSTQGVSQWDDDFKEELRFEEALDYAFPDSGLRGTRAVLIIQNGRILAEKYHPDFDVHSRFAGWSMSKSVINLALGRFNRLYPEAMELSDIGLLEKWKNDPRRTITLENLLRMESGLAFEESYSPFGDVVQMLSMEPDMGAFAASFPRQTPIKIPPAFSYSSATSNILSLFLRQKFSNDEEYHSFLYQDFLGPLGLKDVVLEFDASGTWVASSYTYATARDWARLGQLILSKGNVGDEQFIDSKWVTQSLSSPAHSGYGMHWWLNLPDRNNSQWLPGLPEEIVGARGHYGQLMAIIPSQMLIIIRLGMSSEDGPNGWNNHEFLSRILSQ